MSFHRSISRLSPIAIIALTATTGLASAGPGRTSNAHPQESAHQFVQEIVKNEIREQNGKPIYWRYLEIDIANGTKKVYQVYETKDGTVKRLLAVNGKPLSPAQRRAQETRLKRILNHPHQARKAALARNQDGDKERKLLAMLPNAFLFQYDGKVGNLVRVKFRPNPQFNPPTREAEVFHHMRGRLLADPQQKRLAEINGRLMSEVKFWWGLLGYLDKGGTFIVRQSDIVGKNWKMTRLEVNMVGKALFFKTVGVQENKRFEDYRENPSGMTLRQAIARLEKAKLPRQVAEK